MTFSKVADILAEVLEITRLDITEDMALSEENDIRPVDVSKIVMACEKKFRITIHDEDVYGFSTVGDLADYIKAAVDDGDNDLTDKHGKDEEREDWYYR